MKYITLKDIAIIISHIAGINIHPAATVKDGEGNDIAVKSKIALLVGNTSLTCDFDSDELARAAYEDILKKIDEA